MTKLRSIGCVAVGAAALLAGCGSSSSSGTKTLQLTSFVAKAADTVCSALAKCGCTDSSAVTSCKQAYVSDMTDSLDYQLLSYPGQTLDPVAAQACLDAVKAELADCSLTPGTSWGVTVGISILHSTLPGCDASIFKGLQAAGERCSDDVECAAGLACDTGLLVCATPAAVGGDCSSVSCADTAYCDGTSTCVAKLAAGDTCTNNGYDSWEKAQCATGLSCDYSSTHGHDICAAPVAIDGTCGDGYIPCVTGAYCNSSDVCKAGIADGADCTDSYECLHGWCNSKGKCEDPGICSMGGAKM